MFSQRLIISGLVIFGLVISLLSSFRKKSKDGCFLGSEMQSCIVEATTKHSATLIFLHGLGDTGHGWSEMLGKLKPSHFKLICPHAPSLKVTLNGGACMSAWFDIIDLKPSASQDEDGIIKAASMVEELVEKEATTHNISHDRIVIGGFSQGGALALYAGLTSPRINPGGVVSFSSWLPLHSRFQSAPQMVRVRKDLPVFQAHGSSDPIVPAPMGQLASQFLSMLGMSAAQFNVYPGLGHSSCEEELEDLVKFLNKCCPAAN